MALEVKKLPVKAGDLRDVFLIPGLGRYPGGGHGNPLQYFYLGKSQGQRSLVSYSPQGLREVDTTEVTSYLFYFSSIKEFVSETVCN